MQVRESQWRVREYQHIDLAALMQHLHTTRFTGRVMLHYAGGNVVSVDTCEHDTPTTEFLPAILELDGPYDL